jgi:hypothetical protein
VSWRGWHEAVVQGPVTLEIEENSLHQIMVGLLGRMHVQAGLLDGMSDV